MNFFEGVLLHCCKAKMSAMEQGHAADRQGGAMR
jgi:hypothetical protein